MTSELEYKGKIEIIGKSEDGKPLTAHTIRVKFDGKEIPFLQGCDVWISVGSTPMVVLKFIPQELEINLDDVEVFVRRKETHEPT